MRVQVKGVAVPVEVDTGAARTIMSLEQQECLLPSVELLSFGRHPIIWSTLGPRESVLQ